MILGDSMKNKNGFTLVELMAIIILLGAIITVTYTSVTGVVKRQKLKLFEESLNLMLALLAWKSSKLEHDEISTYLL